MNIIFIQNRPTKAGAQHALKRLVTSDLMKKHKIVIITSEKGWLTNELKKFEHIKIIIEKFPSSRSLTAKIFKNKFWAKKIVNKLNNLNIYPHIIQANEYIENLLAYELSKYYKDCKSAVFFRSALMTKRDFYKYKCDKSNIKIAVSDELKNRITLYYKGIINVVYDFLYDKEFFPPKKRSLFFPKRILIIGNPHPNKGWNIALEALEMFNKKYPNVIKELYFTGIPKDKENFKSINNIKYIFKKYDNLSVKARKFDLVISPSKYESFGLANVETLAAGVILLASKRGVVKDILPKEFLFEPNKYELFKRLEYIFRYWSNLNFDLDIIQNIIKTKFSENNVEKLLNIYKGLNWTKKE
jgi:glycosyltransferase involved in cell wall biosynthesis